MFERICSISPTALDVMTARYKMNEGTELRKITQVVLADPTTCNSYSIKGKALKKYFLCTVSNNLLVSLLNHLKWLSISRICFQWRRNQDQQLLQQRRQRQKPKKASLPATAVAAASVPAPKPGKIFVHQHYSWPSVTAPKKADLEGLVVKLTNSILFEPLCDNFPGIDFGVWNAESRHFYAFQVTVSERHRQWKDEDKDKWKKLFGEPVTLFLLWDHCWRKKKA